jgi:hypothetical protein
MRLHNFILALLAAVLLSHNSGGQTKAEKLLDILNTFQNINKDPSLRKRTIDDAEEFLGHPTDGGGELVGYFHKDSVCKIFVTVGLSYGSITDEYYFRNERLIFVYETEKDFPEMDSIGGLAYNKSNLAFEGRYYFDNDELIDKITKGKRRFADTKENPATFITDANDFLRLIKAKGR